MSWAERAEALFQEGYNCSQAVFLACTDDLGLDTQTRAKLASTFGGGVAGMRQVCGTVSGMALALGLREGYDDPKDRAQKAAQYEVFQKLAERFKEENGSIICRELLGLDKNCKPKPPEERTEAYYKKRPCGKLCAEAAQILEEYIIEKKQAE